MARHAPRQDPSYRASLNQMKISVWLCVCARWVIHTYVHTYIHIYIYTDARAHTHRESILVKHRSQRSMDMDGTWIWHSMVSLATPWSHPVTLGPANKAFKKKEDTTQEGHVNKLIFISFKCILILKYENS